MMQKTSNYVGGVQLSGFIDTCTKILEKGDSCALAKEKNSKQLSWDFC
jgi:hypothetical protein